VVLYEYRFSKAPQIRQGINRILGNQCIYMHDMDNEECAPNGDSDGRMSGRGGDGKDAVANWWTRERKFEYPVMGSQELGLGNGEAPSASASPPPIVQPSTRKRNSRWGTPITPRTPASQLQPQPHSSPMEVPVPAPATGAEGELERAILWLRGKTQVVSGTAEFTHAVAGGVLLLRVAVECASAILLRPRLK
jgi:hypothetical protein